MKTKKLNKYKTKKLKKTKTLNKYKTKAKGFLNETLRLLPNNTPKDIDQISQQINDELSSIKSSSKSKSKSKSKSSSYSPSINNDLITIKSLSREAIESCNAKNAFSPKSNEPLKISIGNNCYLYSDPKARQFLKKNLSANKHVNPDKIITPRQALGNCWFNTMFVSLFVSNKGRKFFHFFRQLMIEGEIANGDKIPVNLRNGFALLNYAIEACLTGNEFAYKMDTNAIIKEIYESLPKDYRESNPYITPIREAGNPIRYYGSLMYYLNNKAINMLFVSSANSEWKNMIQRQIGETSQIKEGKGKSPDVIVLEIFDNESKSTLNKPTEFLIEDKKYKLDSCVVRDQDGNHFSSLLTCEKKEMAYDGMSFHRLVTMDWKKRINTNYSWRFEGSKDADNKAIEWNFLNGYQMLIYYRV